MEQVAAGRAAGAEVLERFDGHGFGGGERVRWGLVACQEASSERQLLRGVGYEDLWVLNAFLDDSADRPEIVKKRRAG